MIPSELPCPRPTKLLHQVSVICNFSGVRGGVFNFVFLFRSPSIYVYHLNEYLEIQRTQHNSRLTRLDSYQKGILQRLHDMGIPFHTVMRISIRYNHTGMNSYWYDLCWHEILRRYYVKQHFYFYQEVLIFIVL